MEERGDIHFITAAVGAVAGLLVAAGGAIDSFNGTLIALGLLVTAATGAYTAWAAHHTKVDTKAIVKGIDTLNEKSIGVLAAEDETRRAESIPHDERTATEQRHIDQSAPPEAPQGPAR